MSKKIIKLDIGSVYQKIENGTYNFRYQVNGRRKAISLKTKNQKEAIAAARKIVPVIQASSSEIIAAHVSEAKGFRRLASSLDLASAWDKYSTHPERATPATVSENLSYERTFNEFIKFVGDPTILLQDITFPMAEKFANHLRNSKISVSTHNRKIRRINKVFNVLKDYLVDENPFSAKILRRKNREEQDQSVRRLCFTYDQEKEILDALNNNAFKVINKPEIRIIYLLGMYTGQRLKDCVLLKWDRVDLYRKKIYVKQFKTGKQVTIPIATPLLAALVDLKTTSLNGYVNPKVSERYMTIDKNKKNVGDNMVNIDIMRVLKWIGLETSVKVEGRSRRVTVYGFHSLRHSFASHCAEANIPKAVVISILGTSSDIIDQHYTHIGDEAQQRAIIAISDKYSACTDRSRIESVLEYIKNLDEKNDTTEKIKNLLLQK